MLPVREEGGGRVPARPEGPATHHPARHARHARAHQEQRRRFAPTGDCESCAYRLHLGGGRGGEGRSIPSPRVRREAARALAKLQTPLAVSALISQLEIWDLADDETVDALGLIGDAEAVTTLIKMLQSPRSMLRRAAARALGSIGDARAIPPLIAAAGELVDPDLRRASLQALRRLGATEGDGVIADALFDPMPSVRIAAAEAVSELELESALPYVRQSLNYYSDEAESEVAYALGAICLVTDLPLILREAKRCASTTTRRRCLLGVARLLKVEAEAYRILLMEGMARDQAVMAMVKPQLKGNKRLRDALNLYSSGREIEAIQHLVPNRRYPELDYFAEQPVEELFLVACVFLSRTS